MLKFGKRIIMIGEEISFKAACDKIVEADFLIKKDGTKPTAEDIFNYSPTGELSQIFDWYRMAIKILSERKLK